MDLRELRSFASVARSGSFSRAARELYLGQPAVSQHVKRLEAELGLSLLTRTTRSVELTEAGTLLLPRVEQALWEIETGVAELEELRGLLRGRLRLGAMQWLEPFDLPAALARFHRAHEAVDVSVVEEPVRIMVADVLSGALDAAFVPLEDDLPAELTRHDLFVDELVVIVAPDSPLAGRRSLRLEVLADEDFVFLREGSGLRRTIEAAARRAGYEPRARFETNELARVVLLVGEGLGVSVVSRSVAEAAEGVVRHVPLRPRLERTVALVWRSGRRPTPAARAFIAHVTEEPG